MCIAIAICARLQLAEIPTKAFLDRYSPKVAIAATIAGKVQIVSIRGPDRVPVQCSIVRNGNGSGSIWAYGPDIALATLLVDPISDTMSVGRPMRLYSVSVRDF